jgi:putative phage-type endonuclease
MNSAELNQSDDREAWLASRAGKFTASRMGDLTAKTKTGWGAGRKNYIAQLVAERLTGQSTPSFSSAAMQHGIDTEAEARCAYEFHADVDVVEVGFIDHPELEMAGASPDGLVGDDGMIEIKCPNTATHIDTLQSGKPDKKYFLQMQWQMECAGRKWCDFVSYDNRMPESLRLFITRIERDEEAIKELCEAVTEANIEVNAIINELQAKAA